MHYIKHHKSIFLKTTPKGEKSSYRTLKNHFSSDLVSDAFNCALLKESKAVTVKTLTGINEFRNTFKIFSRGSPGGSVV